MKRPRNASLAEALYYDIEKDEYLHEIYDNLLYNYSVRLLDADLPIREINIQDAMQFADLLAKCTYSPTAKKNQQWGQEIAILLKLVYPNEPVVKYNLGSVLSAVGNYRGLKTKMMEGFHNVDVFDQIFYEYDKNHHIIPGLSDEFFFRDQKSVFEQLKGKFFSYSGPTSMGKSFVVQTYIKQQIEDPEVKRINYAILVPTKALINEVKSNIIGSLQTKLKELNYRVVTAAGDIVLRQKHHFIFVMTPERLHYMLIEQDSIKVDFLFIDEAHKISDRGGRASYYYKVLIQLAKQQELPIIIFASPNIPNPEVYLSVIPGTQPEDMKKLASRYTPVCQFKYFVDFCIGKAYRFNDYTRRESEFWDIPADEGLVELVKRVGSNKQNVVYCSSRKKVVDYAVEYAEDLEPIENDKLKTLAQEIRNEVHSKCFLADIILKGVAYHVGYLPSNIRLRIERSFEDGDLRTIFCTSTLVEGVNLPADNLFITSYKDGISNMDEVKFRNLVGRVGRIKYNLYGNAILVRQDESLKSEQFLKLLKDDVPKQMTAVDIPKNHQHFGTLIEDLVAGDVQMSRTHDEATEEDFEALRKFALILTRDLATGKSTPVTQAFEPYLDTAKIQEIQRHFPEDKTNDDITLSYDQYDQLQSLIADPKYGKYPELTGVDDEADFEEVVDFLLRLRHVFKWEIYEKETLGKPIYANSKKGGILRWYATILLRWIRGNGLSTIIHYAIQYKENNPETGVWLGKVKYADVYEKNNPYHLNYVIAESLGTIENVLLFSISNYFRKFSLEYKRQHNNIEYFDNDWYDYIEYGTTNPDTIFLQQNGFSREASIFILDPKNAKKYFTEIDGERKIKRSIFECGNLGVETEAQDIQFNIPELFVE